MMFFFKSKLSLLRPAVSLTPSPIQPAQEEQGECSCCVTSFSPLFMLKWLTLNSLPLGCDSSIKSWRPSRNMYMQTECGNLLQKEAYGKQKKIRAWHRKCKAKAKCKRNHLKNPTTTKKIGLGVDFWSRFQKANPKMCRTRSEQ